MDIDIPLHSVRALAAGYRSGRFTPIDACRAALARLAAWEPKLNAFIDPMTEAVTAQAERATAELAAGLDRGVLHGIPVAIKDIIDVAGVPTTHATRAVEPVVAACDATCVARLRAAGAIVFGKTNLLEYAYGIVHPAFGQTNNPFDPSRTAGGSSGGSAAAVAAGIVPLALGTDTGGSVRAPAAYCGIVGLKPTFGLLPLDGVHPLSPSLDHLGILARSGADAEIALAALRDPETTARPPASTATEAPGMPLRLGIVTGQWRHPAVCSEVRTALDDVAARLRAVGATLVEIDLPTPEAMAATLLDILLPEAAVIHAPIHARNPGGYAPGTAEQIRAGMAMPPERLSAAKALQAAWTAELDVVFERVDALIAPTVPFVAPDADPALSAEGDDEIVSLCHADLTGAPSVSVPITHKGGLPIGLQFTGRRGGDDALLALVMRLEALL